MTWKLIAVTCVWLFSTAAYAAPVNVNQAGAKEIAASLKGIGIKKARAIVQHCQKGAQRCTRPEDLLAVRGIGPKTLAKIRTDLRFSGKPSLRSKQSGKRAATPGPGSKASRKPVLESSPPSKASQKPKA